MKKIEMQTMIQNASSYELELVFIPKIMEQQTMDEINTESTNHNNGRGLNGRDAPFITSIYKQLNNGNHLTVKQTKSVRKTLSKYANQYLVMRG